MALITWAIDVPHIPIQMDAILKNEVNPISGLKLHIPDDLQWLSKPFFGELSK